MTASNVLFERVRHGEECLFLFSVSCFSGCLIFLVFFFPDDTWFLDMHARAYFLRVFVFMMRIWGLVWCFGV